jgi:hypothetical protein
MSENKLTYITEYMQTLAGEEVELNPSLFDIFSGVLMRQLVDDADGGINPKPSFEKLATVFTFVSIPVGERPISPNHFSKERISQAENAAKEAVSSSDSEEPVFRSVDIGTFADGNIQWKSIDAGQASFVFTDDASVENFVKINNFSQNDQIRISNPPPNKVVLLLSQGDTIEFTLNGVDHTATIGATSDETATTGEVQDAIDAVTAGVTANFENNNLVLTADDPDGQLLGGNFTDDVLGVTTTGINPYQEAATIIYENPRYMFTNDGTDVLVTYYIDDEGTMNHISLIGVGSESFDPFDDEAGFEAAIGFDAITYA